MTEHAHCHQLVEDYLRWLKSGITVSEENGLCEVVTPFLDRHNDHLAVYVGEHDGSYVISDGGYILADLQMSGVDLGTEKRSEILDITLKGFGVANHEGVLEVQCRRDSLPRAKHNLLQAMLAVDEFYLMSQEHVFSFFIEDVRQFLSEKQIRFIPKLRLTGRSGLEHNFDFAIPSSAISPERLIRAIGNPNRDSITGYCFSWQDTSTEREPNARAVAILNDKERSVPGDLVKALREYEIDAFSWKDRERFVAQLAA